MNNLNLEEKLKGDIITVIGKLATYRAKEDFNNYKSTVDSLELLVNMTRDSRLEKTYHRDRRSLIHPHAYLHSFRSWNKDSLKFFEGVIQTLESEIQLLSQKMDTLISRDDARIYRNSLISIDKLNKIYKRLRDFYMCSTRHNEEYDLD